MQSLSGRKKGCRSTQACSTQCHSSFHWHVAKNMPLFCTQDPRAEQSWWEGLNEPGLAQPRACRVGAQGHVLTVPAQHLSSAQLPLGLHLPWVPKSSPWVLASTKDCSVLCFTFLPLASPQLENLAEDLFLIWDWRRGESTDGSVAGAILALWRFCTLLASVHWVTSVPLKASV